MSLARVAVRSGDLESVVWIGPDLLKDAGSRLFSS